MTPETKEKILEELIPDIEDYVEEYVKPIISRISREIFKENFLRLKNYLEDVSVQVKKLHGLPPLPINVEKTRRHLVQREKLSGTVDAELLKLFENQRKQSGYSTSRMLDVVLWNYFSIGKPHRPQMSFELSESSTTQKLEKST